MKTHILGLKSGATFSNICVVELGQYITRVQNKASTKNFGFTSMLSFSTTVLVSWQAFAVLINGGPSTLVYGLIFSFFGSLATAAALAEMASMSPTSGGQYHWVALLAPRRYSILFITASVAFLVATMIQGGLPVGLILHVIFFFCILVPLVHLAPRSSAEFVLRSFENNGGWQSDGVSWCIGLLTSTYSFSGVDGASHMAEEVDNAATVVPRTMIWSIIVSGILSIGISIAILFCIGDVDAALTTPTGFPIIKIFFNPTKSYAATDAMVSALFISFFFSALGLLASGSQLIWAFARDDGLPFPRYFSHVSDAISTTAFNALISLALLGQYTTYMLSTIFILGRRLFLAKNIPFGPWELGRWGVPINVFTIAFSCITIGLNVLPPYFPVTATNMNYAGVVFGAALIICGILWFWMG
ncbi:putative amino acid permease [Hypoxylon sp. NC0597]|nr:putative amino acid permease [Hypoxylon sp. NC0597]